MLWMWLMKIYLPETNSIGVGSDFIYAQITD